VYKEKLKGLKMLYSHLTNEEFVKAMEHHIDAKKPITALLLSESIQRLVELQQAFDSSGQQYEIAQETIKYLEDKLKFIDDIIRRT
jgi:transcriptional regulatory protein LevR